MNRRYCDTQCPIGKERSEEFLNMHNSAYDAALDFIWFTEECFKTCPYKEAHQSLEDKNKFSV